MKKEKITQVLRMSCTLMVLCLVQASGHLKAQASITVPSTNGYNVNISLYTASIIAPSSCPWGYNFNTRIAYNIGFSGTGIPPALYTLQTNLYCGSYVNFSSLPLSGGSGVVTTATNPYRNNPDCGLATPAYLSCYTFYVTIEGPGIPNQTLLATSTPLPVQVMDFTSREDGKAVSLQWLTSSELNNAYFDVERSADGEKWTSVARIDGHDNSSTVQSYAAKDITPLKGLSFYRLRQVNLDGSSNVAGMSAMNRQPAAMVSISPNPASDIFSVEGKNLEHATLSIMDAVGKTMDIPQEYTRDKITCNTSALQNGIYIISLEMDGEIQNHRLVVNRN